MKVLATAFITALFFSALAVSVHYGTAQTSTGIDDITKPSVPDFTVKLTDSSYDTPPTTATDPFTGQIVTHPSSHVEARTLEIKIKNEPFTPFSVIEGSTNWTAYFFYNIRWKGHYEPDWHEIYSPSNGFLPRDEGSETIYSNQGEYSSTDGLKLTAQGMYITLPPRAEVDFQVEAMIGYTHRVVEGGMAPWYFFGQKSDWSNTQTITIGESQTPTPSPITTPTPPASSPPPTPYSGARLTEQEIIIGVGIAAVVIGAGLGLLIYLIKRK